MEHITCIFCAHDNASIMIEEDGYQGKKCHECSLIYISPRPMVNEVIDIYGHNNAHISAQSHIEGNYLKRLYARHNLGILKKFIKKGTLLEIGAGAGYFLDEARKAGFEPCGIELNPDQAHFMQQTLHIPCEQKPLSLSSFSGKTFDVIYHSDVISHFHDPVHEFHTMHGLLQNNGYLLFETGNIGDVDPRYYSLFPRFQYPDHLFFFTQKTLQVLLERTGFELVAYHAYSIVPQLYVMRWLKSIMSSTNKPASPSARNAAKTKKSLLMSFIKIIYYYALYVLRYRIGYFFPKVNRPQTIIIVAKKK